MIVLRFDPNNVDHQVPRQMRYMMIVDCQANVDVYAGGIGGNLIMSCPYQGTRVVAWPENANQVHVEFLSANIGVTQEVYIWFSELPVRIDFTGEMLGDVYSGKRGFSQSIPYKELSGTINDDVASMAQTVSLAGIQRVTGGVPAVSERARPVSVAASLQRITADTPQLYTIRTATSRQKAQTFNAELFDGNRRGTLYSPAAAGKFCIGYIDFSGVTDELIYLLGARIHILANSAAVVVKFSLDRVEDTATLPVTLSSPVINRLDNIPEFVADTPVVRRVTASNEITEALKTVEIRRQLFELGIMGAASIANPLATPFIFDLANLGERENGTPIMPLQNAVAPSASIFALAVNVDAATSMRIYAEFMWTQLPIRSGELWT